MAWWPETICKTPTSGPKWKMQVMVMPVFFSKHDTRIRSLWKMLPSFSAHPLRLDPNRCFLRVKLWFPPQLIRNLALWIDMVLVETSVAIGVSQLFHSNFLKTQFHQSDTNLMRWEYSSPRWLMPACSCQGDLNWSLNACSSWRQNTRTREVEAMLFFLAFLPPERGD